MESTVDSLLSHDEICDKISKGEKINPIDRFIFNNEPAGNKESEDFRTQFFDALHYVSSMHTLENKE